MVDILDFSDLGLPPIHPFNFEVKLLRHGYSLYVDGKNVGCFCSPYTLYAYLVSNVLPEKLYLNI